MAERGAKESEMIRKGLGEGERESGGKDTFETTKNGL